MRNIIVYGGDTETFHGKPMTLQFYSEDVPCNEIIFCDEKSATKKFFDWCKLLKTGYHHVVYVHNLDFDLPEFLYSYKERLVENDGEFSFTHDKWIVSGVYGKPTFCKISDSHGTVIWIIDSFSFFPGSLARAASLFCPDLPKLRRVSGLGNKIFTSKDTAFVEYAMRDAEIAYWIGCNVQEMIYSYNIGQPVSIADMAAKIFRTEFLDYVIPQPSRDVIDASLYSYHGGKNGMYVQPGWYEHVRSLDLSSAYPFAMSELPAFSDARLYKRVVGRGNPKLLNPVGVYCVKGIVRHCVYPSVFSHGFKPLHGTVDGVWVQGYDLQQAIKANEIRLQSFIGFEYQGDKDNKKSAMKRYVQEFYRLKEAEEDKVRRHFYKLLLNSLYGKFIQTRKKSRIGYTDIDSGETDIVSEMVAGALCHPFIATAITGHTRGLIHKAEHRFKALHTATDGIFTQSKLPVSKTKKLGSLSEEAKGTLALLRNKCYILYTDAPSEMPSKVWKNKYIAKYAMHGFQGRIYDLEELIVTGRRKYKVARPNRLKESLKRGLQVNDFVEREYILKVPKIV